MKNKKLLAISGFILTLVLLQGIYAFGVAATYHEGRALTMQKGETRIVKFNLQNMVGEDDVTVKAELIKGHEIAKLLGDDIYEVPIGTHDQNAEVEVKIDRETPAGTEIPVRVEFKTIQENQAGGIGLGSGMGFTFNVIVSEKVAEREFPWIPFVIILGALIIAILVVLFLRKRKQDMEVA